MQDEHDENEPLLHADVVAAGQYSGDEVADGEVVVATELEADGEEVVAGEKLKLLRVGVGDAVAGGEKLDAGELLLGALALLLGVKE